MSEWRREPLSKLAEFINGRAFKPEEWGTQGLPIIRIANLNNPDAEFDYYSGTVDDRHLVQHGDLLLSWSASLGAYKWKGENAVLNQHIFKVVPSQYVNKDFLFYLLDRSVEKLKERVHGSTMKHIKKGELDDLQVEVPPLYEQRKIAAILSSVDEAIEKTETIIEQTEKVKKGLMQQLLTKGIGHTKFKKTEIGEIPEEWEVKTIGELAEKIIGGGTPPREIQDYYKGKIPWATVKDITYHILDTTEEYISDKAVENSSTNVIPAGNVIIATRIGLGKVFMNTVDMAINQDLKGIIPKKELIEAEYLLWYLLSKTEKIESMGTGTTVKGIRLEQLKGIFIPIPQKNEQKKIVSILNKLEGKIANERKKHITLLSLKKGLMHVLLTGKVRVKVDDKVDDEVVSS